MKAEKEGGQTHRPRESWNPSGPLHSVSTRVLDSSLEGGAEFGHHVAALKPLLERVVRMPDDVQRDLIVLAEGNSLGSLVELDNESLLLLAPSPMWCDPRPLLSGR